MLSTYRHYQKYQLLNMVCHFAPISRKKLIELTGLRPTNVGDLMKELLDEGLVIESGSYSAGPGRKRILLDINRQYLCALAISFTETSVTYTVVRYDGEIALTQEQTVPVFADDEKLPQLVEQQIVEVLDKVSDRLVVGIGLCEPVYGPIAFGKLPRMVSYDEFLNRLHTVLQRHLQKSFSIPVYSYGSASLPALAEHRFGCAVGCEHFLCVELSNGIGASIFSNGRAITGSSNVAGELGHTVLYSNDAQNHAPCYCGKTGCVEQTASFLHIQKELENAIQNGVATALLQRQNTNQPISVSDIREAIEKHDSLCMHYVRLAARRVGIAIANAVTLLNPKLVVLYGFMLGLGDYYVTILKNTILENLMSFPAEFEICISQSTENLLPLGAAAEMFSVFLKTDDHRWIYELPRDDYMEDTEGNGK